MTSEEAIRDAIKKARGISINLPAKLSTARHLQQAGAPSEKVDGAFDLVAEKIEELDGLVRFLENVSDRTTEAGKQIVSDVILECHEDGVFP